VQYLLSAKCEKGYTQVCAWSPWKSTNVPSEATNGEFESIEKLKNLSGMCAYQFGIECRPVNSSNFLKNQSVTCDTKNGLVCYNEQVSKETEKGAGSIKTTVTIELMIRRNWKF